MLHNNNGLCPTLSGKYADCLIVDKDRPSTVNSRLLELQLSLNSPSRSMTPFASWYFAQTEYMTDLHSDLSVDLSGWRNSPTHVHPLISVRMGEIKDIPALCQCSGWPSIFLQFSLHQSTSAYTPDLEHVAM